MEARFFAQNISPIAPLPSLPIKKIKHSPIHSVVTENITGITIDKPRSDNVSSLTGKTVYNDSWIEVLAINHLSQSVQAATGLRNRKNGYDSLVQAAVDASGKFNLIHQRELVLEALANAIPRAILHLIKTLMPQTTFTREYFAAFTTFFFVWLIGPCEVRKSDFNGRKEKNIVHIKKCRFLEETNCIGMCTNLCKVPTQTFIKESLGMPVNMVPNFDDMSCEMIFGEDPPMPTDDPAFKQPCYKLCKVNQKHNIKCTA